MTIKLQDWCFFFVAVGELRDNSDTRVHVKAFHIRFPYLIAYLWRINSAPVKVWGSRGLFQKS